MKKLTIIAFISVIALAFACGTTPEVKQDVAPSGSIVNVQNEQLARIPVEGFEY